MMMNCEVGLFGYFNIDLLKPQLKWLQNYGVAYKTTSFNERDYLFDLQNSCIECVYQIRNPMKRRIFGLKSFFLMYNKHAPFQKKRSSKANNKISLDNHQQMMKNLIYFLS